MTVMLETDVTILEAHVEGLPHQDKMYDTLLSELWLMAGLSILTLMDCRDATAMEIEGTISDEMTTITARVDEIDPETADVPHPG